MSLLHKLFDKFFFNTKTTFNMNIEHVMSVCVYKNGKEDIYNQEQITEKLVQDLLNETLSGKWNRLVMKLQLPEEEQNNVRGIKMVTNSVVSTLVIHAAKKKLACLYYVDKVMHCHMLIGNMDMYCNQDSAQIGVEYFGEAEIPEYGVCKEKKEVEKEIRFIFQDLPNADKRLQDSKQWQTIFSKGKVGYGKLRKNRGLLPE